MPDESNIKTQLNGVCRSLPFSKKVCSKLVDAHFDKFRNLISKILNQKICEDIQAFHHTYTTLSHDQNVGDDILCSICTEVFNIIK